MQFFLDISVFNKTTIREILTQFQPNQNVKKRRNLFSD